MVSINCVGKEMKTMTFGYTAGSKVKVVVNKKRGVVRVPSLLHRMTIWSQRRWCKRNSVNFISAPRRPSKRTAVVFAA